MDQLNVKQQQLEDALASLPEILALVEQAPEIYIFPRSCVARRLDR